MIVLIPILIIEGFLLLWSSRRAGLFPYPHMILIYLMGSQIALAAVAGGVEYPFLALYSTYAFADHLTSFVLLYFAIFLLIVGTQSPPAGRRFDLLQGLRSRLAGLVGADESRGAILTAIAAMYAHLLMIALSVHPSVIWYNTTYLSMSNEAVLRSVNAITLFTIQTNKFVGIVAAAFFGYYWARRRYEMAAIVAPLAIFHFLYELGGHSRLAVLYTVIVALALFIYRGNKLQFGALIGMAIAILLFCLQGRSEPAQGISSIADFPQVLLRSFSENGSTSFLNVFEGAFVTSEIGRYFPTFPATYKILSFSPFPSFIDNFDVLRERAQVPLQHYVPASAFLEVDAFGPPYVVLYVVTQLVAGKLSVLYLSRRRDLTAIVVNLLMLSAAYIQFTYAVRTVYRLFVIAGVISVVGLYVSRSMGRSRDRRMRSRQRARPDQPGAGEPATRDRDATERARRREARRKLAQAQMRGSRRWVPTDR
ncbi:MAG: hypothetical protein KGL48_03395 [Sphingomonadales bacterium]|nr:hypothetical protein [Sphingomonadales bacterium]MDE2567945.1 hypothetical protein [Sphingomonadales bacterium]